jgi:flagellar hook-associated protein 1
MGSGVFNVAVSGLNAAQLGLQTTSHNIASASTEGYSRQRIVQNNNTPLFTGAGFVGQGTSVETVQRMYSQYQSEQVLGSATQVAEMDAYLAQINQISNLLADASAGLSPAMADFFKGVQELAANPASIPARQSAISQAQALVARFQGLDTRVQEIRDGVNQQLLAEIETINSLTTSIGETNQQIILAQAGGPGHAANDLLDHRDVLIADLNKHIKVQAVLQEDGTYNIFIGNGQPVVVGTQVSSLTAQQAREDPERVAVSLKSPYGNSVYLRESQLTGGTLGGLIKFRSESLDAAQNNIGRIAIGLADSFNQIHRTGQDLGGKAGGDFFTISEPVSFKNSQNTGTGELTAQIISSDYRLESDGGGGFTVTRLSDGAAAVPFYVPFSAQPNGQSGVVIDGVTVYDDATPPIPGAVAGDIFVLKPGNSPSTRLTAESTNTGGAIEYTSTGSNLQALTGSDYRLDLVAANDWRLMRLSDGAIWNATTIADFEKVQPGFSMTMTGAANIGDSFTIQPTRTGARNLKVAIEDPRAIAAAAPFRTAAGNYDVATSAWVNNNSGQANISVGKVAYVSNTAFGGVPNLPLAPSPGGDIRLTFSDNAMGVGQPGFIVSGGVTGAVAYDPTAKTSVDITVNGLSFTISGRPAVGDRFTLASNQNGVTDNRTAQQLGALQTTNLLNGPSASTSSGAGATLQSAYSQIVSQIGSKSRQIEVTGKAQSSLLAQSTEAKEQLSGVNLDEEAANLLKYQQAYQASAKMLSVVNALFDELLTLGR